MPKAAEPAAKASCRDHTLTAEFAAMRRMPHNQAAAARAVLFALLWALAPIARGGDPPEAGPGEAVAVGSGPLSTLVTVAARAVPAATSKGIAAASRRGTGRIAEG